LNDVLKIPEYTRPNDNFPYPMMDGCFIKDSIIFANVYRTTIRQMVVVKIDPFSGMQID